MMYLANNIVTIDSLLSNGEFIFILGDDNRRAISENISLSQDRAGQTVYRQPLCRSDKY